MEDLSQQPVWWWPLMLFGASAPVIVVAGVIGFHQLSPASHETSQAPLVFSRTDLRRIAQCLKYFSDALERRIHDAEWHGLTTIRVPEVDKMDLETAEDWVHHARSSASKMRRAVRLICLRGNA